MPIVITGRHRPHEVLLLVFSAIMGLAYVSGAKPPTSIEKMLPGWVLWCWYLMLLVSGLVGLAGIAVTDPYRALVLERASMVGQAAGPLLYAVAVTAAVGVTFAGVICVAWAGASCWRGWQVEQSLRAIRRADE